MPIPKIKAVRFVLAVSLMTTATLRSATAEPRNAFDLKKVDVAAIASHAVYNARVSYILNSPSSQERSEILNALIADRTPLALQALAEVASLTRDLSVRDQAIKALRASTPLSNDALKYLTDFAPTKAVRESSSRRAGQDVTATGSAIDSTDLSAIIPLAPSSSEISLLKKLITQEKDLTADSIREVATDLHNGSRYVVQNWFLKKVLSLQEASDEKRERELTNLLNEIEIYLHQPEQKVAVRSEGELQKFKASLVSPYAMLKDEMSFSKGLKAQKRIRLVFASKMESEIQKFSEAYRQADKSIDTLQKGYFFDLLSDSTAAGVLFRLQLKSLDSGLKKQLLSEISDEFKKRHQSLQTVAKELVDQGAIKFTHPAEQRFFELLITNYFSTYSFEETSNVMKAMIERPDRMSGNDLFRSFVMYAGPQMQKLLQVIGRRQGLSEDLGRTFQALEDAGFNSPWEKVGPNFRLPPQGTKWVSINKTPFVGSMAETYKGIVRDLKTGATFPIAARTLKSDIRPRVANEVPRLVNLARELDSDRLLRSYNFPKVSPAMDDVMSMTKSELDVQETELNQKTGERVYTADKKISKRRMVHFRTAKTLPSEHADVIYSTWLEGEKFESLMHRDSALAIEVAETTAKHWLENALFNERFFHADLHQGNVKVKLETNGDVTVNILDFGMVGRVEKSERSVLIRLSLATQANKNAALIAKYLFALSEKGKSDISESQLIEKARTRLQTAKPEELTMDMWMGWGMSLGLKLPKKITAFGRGLGAVEQLIMSAGSKETMLDLMTSVAMKHALELTPDLAKYFNDAVRSKFSPKSRASARPKSMPPMTCEAAF